MKPCPFRHVDADGHILCDKIKTGDREISLNICRACPITAINCAHLRATLDQHTRPPITVRYGNGKVEVWDDAAPSITLERAACSVKVIPITSPRDCAGCPLRQPIQLIEIIPVKTEAVARRIIASAGATRAERNAAERPLPPPAIQAAPTVNDEPRKNLVATKISQLQEWFTKQKAQPLENKSDETVLPLAVAAGRNALPTRGEEKRAGWTD
ncbi:MAG: hypothetical protein HY327_04910 [Chloroflexi bacterium]|nr:hypothetical protein [Chloroflexota bacterium]